MAPLYDKPVHLLVRDLVSEVNLQPGAILTRDHVLDWFKEKYPKVKEGTIYAHLSKMSVNVPSRVHYNASSSGEFDLFFRLDPSRYRLYDPASDPTPIYKDTVPTATPDDPSDKPIASSEFAYEHDLRDFLAKNLHVIEPGLQLFQEEGITGVEFPAGGRFIDILALDSSGNYVVIELKVSRGYDRTIGQLLRYMAWIELHQANTGQKVRGVIVAKEISQDLLLATTKIGDVILFSYDLSVTLNQV